jgi:hypothetical protein
MPSRPLRLLCVGNGVDHLQTRCAILGSAGYKAKSAALPDAETLLRTEEFDLIMLPVGGIQSPMRTTVARHQAKRIPTSTGVVSQW